MNPSKNKHYKKKNQFFIKQKKKKKKKAIFLMNLFYLFDTPVSNKTHQKTNISVRNENKSHQQNHQAQK
jgi:hypothetical protein